MAEKKSLLTKLCIQIICRFPLIKSVLVFLNIWRCIKPNNGSFYHLDFAGFGWRVKDSKNEKGNPDNHYWSDESVCIDLCGCLKLNVKNNNNQWYGAEVFRPALGYGTYQFELNKIPKWDDKTIFRISLYSDPYKSLDILISKFGIQDQEMVHFDIHTSENINYTYSCSPTNLHSKKQDCRIVWKHNNVTFIFGNESYYFTSPQDEDILQIEDKPVIKMSLFLYNDADVAQTSLEINTKPISCFIKNFSFNKLTELDPSILNKPPERRLIEV